MAGATALSAGAPAVGRGAQAPAGRGRPSSSPGGGRFPSRSQHRDDGSASARQVGLAQTAARAAGTSIVAQRALADAINPSISRLARGGLTGVQIGNLLRIQQSVVAGLAVDLGRLGASAHMESLTNTVKDVSKMVPWLRASVLADFAKGLDLNPLLLPAMPNFNVLTGAVVRPAFEQVHSTFNAWTRVLGFNQMGRTLARIPLLAALRARRAALRGDLTTVRDFIAHWLERRPTEPMVEATIDALLEDDWVAYEDHVIEIEVIEHLRARTTDRYTRRYKMVGNTQILGRSVESLDKLVPVGRSGDLLPLVSVTPDPSGRPAQDVAPADEKRALRALAKFKPEEQEVLLSWSPGMTWQEAAAAAGLTPDVAERVRRKRKRVATEEARRLAQRPA